MTTPKPQLNRLPELDGLRGLAILLVLIGHYFAAISQPEPDTIWVNLIIATRLTWTGVDLFFVLSGFLIGSNLLKYHRSNNFYQVFYFRRICRIFPLYYLFIILFFILLACGAEAISPWLFSNAMPFFAYATFTQNIVSLYYVAYLGFPAFGLGITWSLAIEEQFYLFMPFLVRNLSRRRLCYLIFIVIILAVTLRFIIYIYSTSPVGVIANYVLLVTRADSLMFGVLVALIFATPHWAKLLRKRIRVIHFLFLITGAGLLSLNIARQELAGSESEIMSTAGYTWVGIFYSCLLIILLAQPEAFMARIFRNRVLRWLGKVSYGVYLIHLLILGLCHALLFRNAPKISAPKEALATLLALAISLLIAQLSWKFFESRIVQYGKAFQYS